MTQTCILYAEDNPQDADQTRQRLLEADPGLRLEVVDRGADCLDRLDRGGVDLLLLDHRLPDMDGLQVLNSILRRGIQLPVVMITGVGDEQLVVKALRLGAADYIPKTGDYLDTLPGLLSQVLEDHRQKESRGLLSSPKRRILYLEHQAPDIDLTLAHFAEHAPHLSFDIVESCGQGLARLAQPTDYDLLLIDLRMPDMSGLDFVREAIRLGLTMPAFVMISGQGDDAAAIASLKLGAADYITKRVGYLQHLGMVIEHTIAHDRLRRLSEAMRFQALHDELTGLPNRRLLYDRLKVAIAEAARYGWHVAVLFMDLDDFKQVNDSYGHAIGDQLLIAIAGRISKEVREIDTVSRLGGDEYALILPILEDCEQARPVAERIRQALEKEIILEGIALKITASIGIACFPQDGQEIAELINRADIAMYQSKTAGRNQVQFWDRSMDAAAQRRAEIAIRRRKVEP